jgi:predicted AAA+ superfamily ATPase
MFERILNFDLLLKRKSLFLLGPRQTGKSTYLRIKYPDAHLINFLKPSVFLKFQSNPNLFGEEVEYQRLKANTQLFIVDEIQKLPFLLDEIHRLIEEYKGIRFIMTGSSARKLKRAGVNLLGGRASRFYFHPITSAELGFDRFERDLFKI